MIAEGVSALPFDDHAGFTAPAAFGPFRVLHQIGSGVLGPVFRTFDPQKEKLVAVKAFRLDLVPESSARLADILTRMAAAPVKHPAVVGVLDAGIEGTTAYLAMEYVAAETLDVVVRRLAPAPLETAVPILRQIAEALEAGWAAGMAHGALHPRDIFVTPPSAEIAQSTPVVRVSGFGVTDALDELRIPTPVRRPYTAPEREHAGEWDIRADVYSLGVIAYELLTGQRPAGPAELEQGAEHHHDAGVHAVLSKALAMNPQDRFDRPMALVDALAGDVVEQPEAVEPAQQDVPPVLPWTESEASELESAPEPETAAEPEPEAVYVPTPVELPPLMEPARESRRTSASMPVFAPQFDPPRENHGRRLMVAVLSIFVVGAAVTYWLRGPAPSVTKAPPDEPIGTDVAVTEPKKTPPVESPAAAAPKATSTPPAAPTPARGRLLVRSVPAGATVSINGRAGGSTPAALRDLPFGTYTIAVSRPGYQPRDERVTLTQTVPARELTLELASAARTGSIRVVTKPAGATIAIDGRILGTAPMQIPEMSPGSHTVRVTLPGHRPVTTSVVVRAGQQALVSVSLEISR